MDSDIIPKLHNLSKELRQLQHLFGSYKTLIERITSPRTPDLTTRGSSDVELSQSARHRFDRLIDQLQLLMLNTITEYLEEKNALSDTYFNLTAQIDSQATARLTRSATLLAKLSVFFLPVTFITSFFSIEVKGIADRFTPKDYWIAFGLSLFVSLVTVVFFSRMLSVSKGMRERVKSGWFNVRLSEG